ncbi:hypothetical protein [uncultured Bacteroides sp.]|uniref:hypothetical protein n=1 Tax=uncultured Bacteroides sp. TaxID=162156 RepID=UPI0025929D52|nr:hypothetical protein [uncultured Bacteroides sp.]
MISYNDIKDILNSLKTEGIEARVRDVAYLVMCDSFVDKALAAKVAYQEDEKPSNKVLSMLAEKLKPFGIGAVTTISKDENREELLKLLQRVQDAEREGTIDPKDAIKIEADIRVKLNDKFNIEEEEGQKRIIVVPQKHDIICKWTSRECSAMPSKEACMKYYNLIDADK